MHLPKSTEAYYFTGKHIMEALSLLKTKGKACQNWRRRRRKTTLDTIPSSSSVSRRPNVAVNLNGVPLRTFIVTRLMASANSACQRTPRNHECRHGDPLWRPDSGMLERRVHSHKTSLEKRYPVGKRSCLAAGIYPIEGLQD